MVELDGTNTHFIKNKVRQVSHNPKIGHVIKVYEHVDEDDKSNFEVDIAFPGDETHEGHGPVPVVSPHSDSIAAPKVGDRMYIDYLDGNEEFPVARGYANTNLNRSVRAEPGMWRQEIDCNDDKTPVGKGQMYMTTQSRYDQTPSLNDYRNLNVDESFIRFAKKKDAMHEPSDAPPMFMEMFDSKKKDQSHIRLKANEIDKDPDKSMEFNMDFKDQKIERETLNATDNEDMFITQDMQDGVLRVKGVNKNSGKTFTLEIDVRNQTAKFSGDGSSEMGFSMDFTDDSFKLLDGSGYGIESDGSGNFTWHYDSIDYSENTTTSL